MRRLLGWVLNGLAAVSVLFCVAACVLWLRSYWTYDLVGRVSNWDVGGTVLISFNGRVIFNRIHKDAGIPPEQEWVSQAIPSSSQTGNRMSQQVNSAGGHWWNRLGFAATYAPGNGPNITIVRVMIPYWLVIAVAALAPGIVTLRKRRQRIQHNRLMAGLCPRCGYDLRATPDGTTLLQRCPECGTVIPPEWIAGRILPGQSAV